jgi:proline iminopeptidase
VPHPRSELTCAITVHAPAKHIWPWFVQLGCQRGGWYSYDLLDNGGSPSAERILPEYQHLEVGEIVKAVPNGSFGFPVAIIEPGHALSLAGVLNTKTGEPADLNDPKLDAYFAGDQTFVIEHVNEQTSRIVFRMRIDWNPTRLNTFIYRCILEPISFVMTRKMLLNLKRRAEMLASEEVPQVPLVAA